MIRQDNYKITLNKIKLHTQPILFYLRLFSHVTWLRLIDMFRFSQSSGNRKSAKSVIRMVFKSLDFNEMQSEVTWDFT